MAEDLDKYEKALNEAKELQAQTRRITGVVEISKGIDEHQSSVSHAFDLNLPKKIELLKKAAKFLRRKIEVEKNGN